MPEICRIFEMTDDTLYTAVSRRRRFDRFDEEGPQGLFDRERSGRPREVDEDAEGELERVLASSPQEEGYAFTTWTVPLLRSHLKQRQGLEVSDATVRRALDRLGFVWRRPRWWIDYKDPDYEARMAAIEEVLAEPGEDTTVLFEDETTFRRLPPLRGMWMRRGEQARVGVPESNGKFALYGVLDPHSGEIFTESYPKGKSQYTSDFLERLMAHFEGKVLLIWDQAQWHTSKMVEQVIAGYERLEILLLPKREPQENPVEDLWRHLKRIIAANLERSLDALKEACRAFFDRLSNQDALRMAGLTA